MYYVCLTSRMLLLIFVDTAGCEEVDVVFVLENSGVMTEVGFYAMTQLAQDIMQTLPPTFHIGLIVYSGKATIVSPIAKLGHALLGKMVDLTYT